MIDADLFIVKEALFWCRMGKYLCKSWRIRIVTLCVSKNGNYHSFRKHFLLKKYITKCVIQTDYVITWRGYPPWKDSSEWLSHLSDMQRGPHRKRTWKSSKKFFMWC